MPSAQRDATTLLRLAGNDPLALAELYNLIKHELRRRASRLLAREGRDPALQTTVLVDDVLLKLVWQKDMSWQDRGQFYRLSARAMREILVDQARKRRAERRGKGQRPVALDRTAEPAQRRGADTIAIHEALETLELKHPLHAEIVELHHFGGWTLEEIAPLLGITKEAAKSRWRTAKARLHQILSAEGAADGR